jgi:hypothetical protein
MLDQLYKRHVLVKAARALLELKQVDFGVL